MNKVEVHRNICNSLNDTYKAKNNDYGDSFAKVRNEYPEAIIVRLMDKLERLKMLLGGRVQQVKDESIDDTLLDLANYCIMEIVERKSDSRESEMLSESEKVQAVMKDLMTVGEAVDILAAKEHAEHYWQIKE